MQAIPGKTSARVDCEIQIIGQPLIMKTNFKYEIIIFWSEDDQSYIAELPELPGCMADGETYLEALTNAENIAHEWIETAKELGRTIPEPRGRLKYA